VHPVVPEIGSVGAGDLGPMAGMAQVAVGQGRAEYQGEELPGGEALRRAGITPLVLSGKDGLVLVSANGVSIGRVADALSFRVVPQVHGALREYVAAVRNAVTVELNSADDNPLVSVSDQSMISNGNFHPWCSLLPATHYGSRSPRSGSSASAGWPISGTHVCSS
jgi:histidine ammonia-lyase